MTFKEKRRPDKKSVFPVNYKRLFIGMGAVALGIAVYLTERPHDTVAFIRFLPFDIGFLRELGGPIEPLAGFLPDMAHIFGFILLTGALTPQTRTWDRLISMGWLGVETAFEVAQGFGEEIAAVLPRNFADHPLQRQITAYFIQGTFDPLDLAGIFIGMIVAYWVLCRTRTAVSPL